MKTFKLHLVRCLMFLLGLLVRTNILYILIGLFNRFNNRIDSIFICYAGSRYYADKYCYPVTRKFFLWWPSPIAIFKQGSKWGIVFATPMDENDFTADENRQDLLQLLNRLEYIAGLLKVNTINYAGILPSFLVREKLIEPPRSLTKVAEVVKDSLDFVSAQHFDETPTVILIGGNGAVGLAVKKQLDQNGWHHETIDPRDSGHRNMPEYLNKQPVLVLDVSRAGVINNYLDQFWRGVVVVNETFPEPGRKTIESFKERNLPLYHVSGVEGKMYPSLPGGYKNAVPCCAIHSFDTHSTPVVKNLTE